MYKFRFYLFIYFLVFPYVLYSKTVNRNILYNEMDSLYQDGKIKDSYGDYEGSLRNYKSAEGIRLEIKGLYTEDTDTLALIEKYENSLNFRRGQANVQLERYTKARPYLKKAYNGYEGDNYNSLMARIIYLMILETRMGYFKLAKEYRRKGEQLIKKHSDSIAPQLSSNFYKNAGQLYYEMDICDTAQINAKKALSLSSGDLQKIEVHNLLANIADELEEYKKAISLHLENIKELKAFDDSLYLREAYLNISVPYMKSGQYAEAIQSAKTSMSYCPEGNTGNICRANAYNNMSDAYRMSGQLDSAVYYAHQSLIHHLQEEGFSSDRGSIHFNPSKEIVDKEENLIRLLEYLKSKALAQEKIYQKASNSEQLKTNLNSTLNTWKMVQEKFMDEHIYSDDKPFWNKHSKEMYDMMMRLAYEWDDNELAYHAMEKSRAMLLRDRLRNLRFVYEYGIEERDLERLSNNPSYQAEFNAKYPGISKMLSTSIPKLNELKTKIAHDQVLVYYLVSEDGNIYALVLDGNNKKNKIFKFHLDSKLLKEWKRNLENYGGNSREKQVFDSLGNQIFNTIFAPIKTAYPVKRFIIVPDGEIYGISFDALYDNHKEYLVENYAFSYIYSGEMLMQDISKDKGGNFMGFAPVDFLKYPDLKLSRTETETIANGYNSNGVFFQQNATKSEFLKQIINGRRIIHISSHGEMSDEETCIYFYGDTSLLLSEIAQLKIPEVEVVSLSACKTSDIQIIEGKGVLSLSKAFIMAGADWVFAPQGYINEEIAHEIFTKLHEYQTKGNPPDIALQKIKKNIITERRGNIHFDLKYWSQVIIVGNTFNGDAIDNKTNFWLWLGVGIVIFIIIGFIFYRKNF